VATKTARSTANAAATAKRRRSFTRACLKVVIPLLPRERP
jgi:hypothetical protein